MEPKGSLPFPQDPATVVILSQMSIIVHSPVWSTSDLAFHSRLSLPCDVSPLVLRLKFCIQHCFIKPEYSTPSLFLPVYGCTALWTLSAFSVS
jgi:hypothetical protein